MKYLIILAFAMLGLVGITVPGLADAAAGSVQADGTVPESQDAIDRISADIAMLDDGEFAEAQADLLDLSQSSSFLKFDAHTRAVTWYLLGVAETNTGDIVAGLEHVKRAGDTDPSVRDGEYLLTLSSLAMQNKDDALGVDALIRAIQAEPKTTERLHIYFVMNVVRQARKLPDGGAARRQLLEVLWAAQYTSDDPFYSEDLLWWGLFKEHVDHHEDDEARRLLPMLTNPEYLIRMHADGRFSRFVAGAPFGGNVDKALDVELAELRTKVQNNPRLLAGPQALILALTVRNQLPEALALADKVIERAEASLNGKLAYLDQNVQLRWVYDARTRVLIKMGRKDEALRSQMKARDIALASGDDLASQNVNLGDVYYSLGRPQDALEAVKDITVDAGTASPYGLMIAEEVRACAYAQLGDISGLEKTMAYMKSHGQDGYGPLRLAMLCVGDVDDMAHMVVSQLDDPITRTDMLVDLQTYMAAPHPTELDTKTAAVFEAVKARPEVKAAIAKYGAIGTYSIFGEVI